ncbi:MAG: hypothetical protein J6V68_04170 [Clostridia bacterium]|nr:hypothetical protein [Clostridia bacterium]
MKDYFISVPIGNRMLTKTLRETVLKELKRTNVKRIFTGAIVTSDDALHQESLRVTRDNVKFFKDNGYEVGIWILSSTPRCENNAQKQIRDDGKEKGFYCHADEKILSLYSQHVYDFAMTGADIIMFDDDFHSSHGGFNKVPGCFCPHHERIFNEKFPHLDFSLVKDKFWEDSEYKQAYLSVMGEVLENYARTMRQAADNANPSVRLAVCLHPADYYINGTDAATIAKLLAGNTKPLVRLIGAPYWDFFADYPDRLSTVIELERAQMEWFKDKGDIEIMAEGDTFPRPRSISSSATLECFDIAIRADGKTDGILKYMMDYFSNANYECGYMDNHIENQKIHEDVRRHFADKTATGVRVYTFPEKVKESLYKYSPTHFTSMIRPNEGFVLTQLGIPTTYEGEGVTAVAFGENARWLTDNELKNGLITDIVGARALTDLGVDCGFLEDLGGYSPAYEDFGNEVKHRITGADKGIHKVKVKDGAKVLSYYIDRIPFYAGEPMEKVNPSAYLYENAKGQRFYVLCFDASVSVKSVKSLLEHYRSYAKTEQVIKACEWLSGNKLPAYTLKNPDVYIMCKEDEKSLSVGVWNFSRDKIRAPKITLDKEYKSVTPINGTASLSGDTVTLSTLYPFEFMGFVVEK